MLRINGETQSIQQVIEERSALLFALRADLCSEIVRPLTEFIVLSGGGGHNFINKYQTLVWPVRYRIVLKIVGDM